MSSSSSSSTSSRSSLSSTSSNFCRPKVALIGSGGLLGDATLNAFLSPAFSDYFAKPIRVFTRNIDQALPGGGLATFVRVDWDDDNIEDYLARCLRGVSVVVNLLGYNPSAWDIVTRAVCRVKPQLYIPPEFSFDHTLWSQHRIPVGSVVYNKQRQTEYARAAGVRTIQIFCGMIMENLLADPARTGVDFNKRRILAVSPNGVSEPSTLISFTSSWDVGRAIAAVATMPASILRTDVKSIYISGDTSSWSRLAGIMNALPQPVEVSSFESQCIHRSSPIEAYLRIAAAEGQLYFPSSHSSRRHVVSLNQNGLVDSMAIEGQDWVKLSMTNNNSSHFCNLYLESNELEQPDSNSSPEISSPEEVTGGKRKRGASDSASAECDAGDKTMPHGTGGSSNHDSRPGKSPKITRKTATSKPTPSASAPRMLRSTRSTRSTRSARTGLTSATTQPEPTVVLEKRMTRSMTKRQTATAQPHQQQQQDQPACEIRHLATVDESDTRAAVASNRRNTKRRRAG
ncbi:hypothetical protein DRE_03466 [Drechslerella stenobrocha 248]|uniref:NmrA-like domain-containing protein n=1 Tax=Drechslerella stenobrocha 248 TaxID=1043628 RepID=W7I3W2_9PEZI|nr:hypothetical protein DRE_03466 [Drechslerella stenobrocha 248]